MFRRKPATPSELSAPVIGPRWRTPVAHAEASRVRYHEVVAGMPAGPLRDRVAELGEGLDDQVAQCRRLAERATSLESVVAGLDPDAVTARHTEARRTVAEAQGRGPVPDALIQQAEAMAGQHASVQRLLDALDDTEAAMGLVRARLGQVVAHAAELAFRDAGDAGLLEQDLVAVARQLRAMGVGLDELR